MAVTVNMDAWTRGQPDKKIHSVTCDATEARTCNRYGCLCWCHSEAAETVTKVEP